MVVEQVGGDHYKAAYQHWDWALDTQLGYAEGNASAYVTRFKKKGGTVDLEKAFSYIQKLVDHTTSSGMVFPAGSRYFRSGVSLLRFLIANDLKDTPAGEIIAKMDGWKTEQDLLTILSNLRDLIDAQSEV